MPRSKETLCTGDWYIGVYNEIIRLEKVLNLRRINLYQMQFSGGTAQRDSSRETMGV